MAGNRPGDNSGNVLVEFDYNNIIVVDPNKTIDALVILVKDWLTMKIWLCLPTLRLKYYQELS